jgi:hypothetical protein
MAITGQSAETSRLSDYSRGDYSAIQKIFMKQNTDLMEIWKVRWKHLQVLQM